MSEGGEWPTLICETFAKVSSTEYPRWLLDSKFLRKAPQPWLGDAETTLPTLNERLALGAATVGRPFQPAQ